MANILYKKQKQQKSLDNGVTWIDTGEYRVGDIIENPSNCSGTDTKQCRWVELDASEGYYCDGNSNSKYTIQVEECTENGLIWTRTGNSKKGNTFIESNSCDCGYSEYRWNLDPYRYECDENSFSKYGVEVYQVGCGDNWQNVEPLQERTTDELIECYSLDCGMSSNEIILTIEKVDEYSKGMAIQYKLSTDSNVYCDYPFRINKCIDLTDSGTTVTLNVRDYLPCKNVIGIKLLGEGNYSPCGYNTTKIKRVDKMMDTKYFKSFYYMFPTSVEFIDTTYINTENALTMENMFDGCENLTSLDVSNFNTSNVTEMSHMFRSCKKLTSLDLSNFDTSNVTNMAAMFYGCTGLRELDLSGWNFSKITNDTYGCDNYTFIGDMSHMFYGLNNCYINLRDTTYENFDKIVSYNRYKEVFSGCTNVTLDLNGLDNNIVAGWQYLVNTNTLIPFVDFVDIISDNIVNTGGTILSCYVRRDSSGTVKINSTTIDLRDYTASDTEDLATIDLVDYMPITSITFEKGIEVIEEMPDTSNVKHLSFTGVGKTFVIPNKLFNSIENITSMSNMFGGLRLGKEIDWGYLTVPLLTRTDYMFYNCSYVEKIDLSNWNCSIDDWSCMFWGCSSLEEINLSGWDLSNAENNSGYTFYGCDNLKRIILNDVECETYQKVVNRLISEGLYYNGVEIETNIVLDDCPIEDYMNSDILFTLNSVYQTCKLKINNKFYTCSPVNGDMVKYLNIDDTVTSLYQCFEGIKNYINNLVNFNIDTSNVTDMEHMFYGCSGLTSLDLSSFDTSNVTNMSDMFYNCKNLTSLDLSSFDTSKVTDMSYMFIGCSGLTSLNVSSFNISNVTNTESMFGSSNSSLSTLKVKQGTRAWWYSRLKAAKIQNQVTIIEV